MSILLCLLLSLELLAGDEEEKLKRDFEDIWTRFTSEYEGKTGLNDDVVLFYSPHVKEFMKLGVGIVPHIVEKLQAYDMTKRTIPRVMTVVATALLESRQIGEPSRLTDEIYEEYGKGHGVIWADAWLKWWEEEGKKLYEKRMKELKEKENAQEKPDTQEPKELPEEEPPPEEPKQQPEPEKTTPQPPTEPSQAESEVQKPLEPIRKVPPSESDAQPESTNWLVPVLTIAVVVLAGAAILLLLRRSQKTI